jgi:hypothetical protein
MGVLQIRIYIAHDCILFNNKVKKKFRLHSLLMSISCET